MNKKIISSLRFVVSFGLLGGLVWMLRKDAEDIVTIIRSSSYKYLLWAFLIFLVNTCSLSYRLKIVFRGENLEISFFDSVRLTFMGYFFNNFMPSAVGGDLVKAHLSASLHSESKIRAYASVMMDRIIGLYSFLLVAAVALFVDNNKFGLPFLKPIVFSFIIIGIGIYMVVTHEKVAKKMEFFFLKIKMGSIGEKLDSLYKIVHDYRNRREVVVKALTVSIISQSVYFLTIFLFFKALNSDIYLGNVFLVMPVVTFISMIPSIGGLGVREGAIVAFFTPIAGKETAFAVSILLLSGLFLISMMGGLFYFFWNSRQKKYIHS